MIIYQDPVPLRAEEKGVIRVGATRVLYALVIHAFDDGATPEEIVRMYETLKLADVYGVIAYYLNHREDVQAYLREREIEAEKIRAVIEANQTPREEIRARLEARRAALERDHAQADK
jgi:uncharacterized protein (DUF433 family)